jgi:hypothetical protein
MNEQNILIPNQPLVQQPARKAHIRNIQVPSSFVLGGGIRVDGSLFEIIKIKDGKMTLKIVKAKE